MAKRKTPPLQPAPRHPSAGLLRCLGALLDYLVVIALLIIAGFIGMGWPHLLLATGMASVPRARMPPGCSPAPLQRLAGPSSSAVSTPGSGSAPARPSACGPGACASRTWTAATFASQALIRLATSAFGLGNLLCVQSRPPRPGHLGRVRVVVPGKTENLDKLKMLIPGGNRKKARCPGADQN